MQTSGMSYWDQEGKKTESPQIFFPTFSPPIMYDYVRN